MRKIMINGGIEPTANARSLAKDIKSEMARIAGRKRQAREAAKAEKLKPRRWNTFVERSIPNEDKDD